MNLTCIFDSVGQDGQDNKKAWQALPSFMRLIVRQTQQKIMQMLLEQNPGRNFRKTSGFRSPLVTSRYGGSPHSLHHWGGAVDIARDLGDSAPGVADGFVCVIEHDHYHIQYEVV